MSKIKIVIIGPFPKPITGVSIANYVLYNGMQNRGHFVEKIDTEFASQISQSQGTFNMNKFKMMKSYFEFQKIVKSNIVYLTTGQTFLGLLKYVPFIVFSKIFRKKTILHLHGNHLLTEYNGLKGIKKYFFRRIIRMVDYGIALSESLEKNFIFFLPKERIFTLNNFFQNHLLIPKEEVFKNKSFDRINILFLSNLMEEKGINILIKVVKELVNEGFDIYLKIAGNKIKENDLDEELKSNVNIEYVGEVVGEGKEKLLLWSNVFCLPTFYKMEGQPISILEAMITGNLILTTKHAGITDVCNDKSAEFVEKKSLDSLKKKLLFLNENKYIIKKKSEYNYEYSKEKFSEERFILGAEEIINKCLN